MPRTTGRGLLRWLFAPSIIGRESAITASERLAATQIVMASLEHLANDAERRPGGVCDWEILRPTMRFTHPVLRAACDRISRPTVTNVAHAARLAAAGLLMTPYGTRGTRGAAGAALAVSSHLLAPRHHIGGDGSDHAAVVVNTLSAAARLTRDPRTADALLWGISLQGTLAYAVSGWVKLAGSPWRDHRAIPGVMRTVSYGNRHVHALITARPWVGKAIGVGTLVGESAFPLVLLAKGRLTKPFIGAMGSMHLGIAGVMGLGRFVPAFFGLYPALLYTTGRPELRPREAFRSDTAPKATIAVAASAAAGLAAANVLRRRELRLVDGLRDRIVTPAGNVLAFQVDRHPDPEAPTYVLENGLMATAESWAWLVEQLNEHGNVVTYDPAGYGCSTKARGLVAGPDTRREDLAFLASRLRGAGPLVLVGHSMGGHVVDDLAGRGHLDVNALVLVDPTHPQELERSPQQRVGAARVDDSLRVAAWSTRLGLGVVTDPPTMTHRLPERVRRAVVLKHQMPGVWATGLAEWTSLRRVFAGHDVKAAHAVPTLVITAEETETRDAAMGLMHDELASGPFSRRIIVTGAGHQDVIVSRTHARRCAEAIVEFVDGPAVRLETPSPAGEPRSLHKEMDDAC